MQARDRGIVDTMVRSGMDLAPVNYPAKRALLGLPIESDPDLLARTPRCEFERVPTAAFGTSNPHPMNEPFWIAMIRSGCPAWTARTRCGADDRVPQERLCCTTSALKHAAVATFMAGDRPEPIWCANRFGQSFTFLPDGRAVLVGGEHEDSYDVDFCIYNDVIVHDPDGTVHIYAYPDDVFEPTDHHTATRIEDFIYLIGSLGYSGHRHYGQTPVYRLDTRTWNMERVRVSGTCPGWIHGHRAMRVGPRSIQIWDGEVLNMSGNREIESPNKDVFILDLDALRWSRIPGA
jgi:hypothetical protein